MNILFYGKLLMCIIYFLYSYLEKKKSNILQWHYIYCLCMEDVYCVKRKYCEYVCIS